MPACPADIVIRSLVPGDAGELLTVQRAAYVSEAQLYGTPHLPALVQTYDDLLRELAGGHGYAAVRGQRLVGAVRVHERDGRMDIARLVVAPDLRLYRRHGYTETHREPLGADVTLVHLVKQLRGTSDGAP